MSVAVIIAASGSGTRLGGDMPKQFQMLGGKPVLAHTLEAFNRLDIINTIVIAAPAEYVIHTQEICTKYGYEKVLAVVPGGTNRAESVYAALKKLPANIVNHDTDISAHTRINNPKFSASHNNTVKDYAAGIVLIHDGVRPFVTDILIKAVVKSTHTHGAAIAGTVLTDTLKEADENGQVISTPSRERFWRTQTPQGFTYQLIMKAYAQGEKDGILPHVTDDSALVERLGVAVQMVEGHPSNIKITTREDMLLGEVLLRT